MKTDLPAPAHTQEARRDRWSARRNWPVLLLLLALLQPIPAEASMFKGEALDKLADVLAWVVLIVAPVVGIAVFWLVHILPEKIAEKREHPQAKAIQCLCLLSLVFGGLLWPIAWLWAYSKPVLYKLAYGTDRVAHGHGDGGGDTEQAAKSLPGHGGDDPELRRLRKQVAELESKLAGTSAAEGGKA